MAMIRWNSIFDSVEERMVMPQFAQQRITIPTGRVTIRMTPEEARRFVCETRAKNALHMAIWRQAVVLAQSDTTPEGMWRLFAVWLTLPRVQSTVYRITARFGLDRKDIQAELMLALLEGLESADPEQPGVGDVLIRTACNRAWRHARQTTRETAVADVPALAAARTSEWEGSRLSEEGGWELHVALPSGPDRLPATLRFTASPEQIEGERLGALAERLSLSDVVHRARRPGRGTLIGTLSLRPMGSRR